MEVLQIEEVLHTEETVIDIDIDKLASNNTPIKFENGHHCKIMLKKSNEPDIDIYYDRVIKISIVRNNLIITQISDGEQDLWECSQSMGSFHLGNLVGITYRLLVCNYTYLTELKIVKKCTDEEIIPKHKNDNVFSNIQVVH
jgi:hypothetical protein